MYARAKVNEALVQNAILAPQQAVTRDPKGGATVMLVNAQGKAEQRPIQTGEAIGNQWLVTQGLSPGDRLIVEGLQRVQPGVAVRAVPAGSPPSASKAPSPGAGRP
jgi:membrane fusion protein (multidrug efflux system)